MTAPDFEATADAFERLSDPVRVELLRELWLEGRHDPVPYAALQDTVGVRDSGRFNYHLQRLTDVFVEKTDDGY
ncbi:MAG: winged helix-turn-helix domain-containing protein, partial [Halobacterium sp.]